MKLKGNLIFASLKDRNKARDMFFGASNSREI
jgi:hypothetical protein